MRRRSVLLGAAIAAMVIVPGCRASQSDRATAAVHEVLAAFERGDGAGVCDRLSEHGVSELLLLALEERTAVGAEDRRSAETCARIATRLDVGSVAARLRRSPVRRVVLHGTKATVETDAGSYEAEEREGEWQVARFEPLASAAREDRVPARPVALTLVRPHFDRPAVGATRATETTKATIELSATLRPPDARVSARSIAGGPVERADAADGRFRARLALRPGTNVYVLRAQAPGHEPSEITVRVRRR